LSVQDISALALTSSNSASSCAFGEFGAVTGSSGAGVGATHNLSVGIRATLFRFDALGPRFEE